MDYELIDALREELKKLIDEVNTNRPIIESLQERNERNAPKEEYTPRDIVAEWHIHQLAINAGKKARPVLLQALQLVEAGKPLPPFGKEIIADLNAATDLLKGHTGASAEWRRAVEGLLSRLAPYLKEGEPRYYLNTNKSREELARLFHALVEHKFISGAAPESLQNFCNAFDSDGEKPQGVINWIWTAKRNKQVSPAQILDFVYIMAGAKMNQEDKAEYTAVERIFGITISDTVRSHFRNNKTEIYQQLLSIVNNE